MLGFILQAWGACAEKKALCVEGFSDSCASGRAPPLDGPPDTVSGRDSQEHSAEQMSPSQMMPVVHKQLLVSDSAGTRDKKQGLS